MSSSPIGKIAIRVLWQRRARLCKLLLRTSLCAICIFWALVSLLPFIWMVSAAAKPIDEVISVPIRFFPTRFYLFGNINDVLTYLPFSRWMANSVFLVIVLATTDVLVSSLAGYALAKFEFPGRQIIFLVILAMMMISFQVLIVPLYILVKNLGWLDSYLGLMAPAFVSAFGVFFMRQFMVTIPSEYVDAARIDGASEPAIYWRVVMPMVRPAIVTLVILRFRWEWDSLLWPVIVVSNKALRTLPLALTILSQELSGTSSGAIHHTLATVLAGCFVTVLPVLLAYLLLQRQFMNAMATSGLKF